MHILTLIGARPQFIKAAPVSKALAQHGITETIVHSGQHYDFNMSDVFWIELGIPEPKHKLVSGGGSHATQTATIMVEFEKIVQLYQNISAVLVYGDTNTTLAASLVASKLHIPIIHIEAGLRSFNREMPEEINRILTDTISSTLFCTSQAAVNQLNKENIIQNVFNCGDVMYDAFLNFSEKAKNSWKEMPNMSFSIFTIHRQNNTESAKNLNQLLAYLSHINHTIIWPVHPRIDAMWNNLIVPKNVIKVLPLSYLQMLQALQNCTYVFTDSGGLQKEAYWAKKQCFTFRTDTEWVETLKGNWNQLITSESSFLNAIKNPINSPWIPLYGNGNAANTIASTILKLYA